jgi:pimeloyl-ACP methyl ester carboxylesterase
LVEGGGGWVAPAGDEGRPKTGPSPVDRARPGSKHHLITEGHGILLAGVLTGCNRNDVTQLMPLIEAVPPVRVAVVGRGGGRTRCSPIARMTMTSSRRSVHAGPLLAHDTTADVARDMDLLRQAVGDPTMNYIGTSYGSYLGATYANLFPTKVRAITLDADVDPVAWATGTDGSAQRLSTFLRMGSDKASAVSLNAFLDLCGSAPTGSCAFSAGSPAATHAKWNTLLDRLASHPVTVGERPSPSSRGGRGGRGVVQRPADSERDERMARPGHRPADHLGTDQRCSRADHDRGAHPGPDAPGSGYRAQRRCAVRGPGSTTRRGLLGKSQPT